MSDSGSPVLASKPSAGPTVAPLARTVLLTVSFLVPFIDNYNGAAFFVAIPPISAQLHIPSATSVWLIAAYQLAFAAFMLSSGRLSDLFGPKWVLVAGLLIMSFSALGAGFVRDEVPLIILRALQGLGAAMNVPSAMACIIRLCPEQPAQARALAVFSSIGGIGGIIGLFIGAAFVKDASWPWVLYFTTIFTFLLTLLVLATAPAHFAQPAISLAAEQGDDDEEKTHTTTVALKHLDLPGIVSLTSALILFIFAVTNGGALGWRRADVLAPLLISAVLLTPAFFLWESRLSPANACVPPLMWRYKNFALLSVIGLLPIMWWTSVQFLFSWLWQEVYFYSSVKTAVHLLPLMAVCFVAGPMVDILQKRLPLKRVVLIGQALLLIGTILLPFANTPERYARFVIPGMIIGSIGNLFILATANVALFHDVPADKSAMAAAVFQSANQLGSATGSAIIASIQADVGSGSGALGVGHAGGGNVYTGTAAGFWFLFAINVVGMLGVAGFMRYVPATEAGKETPTAGGGASGGHSVEDQVGTPVEGGEKA